MAAPEIAMAVAQSHASLHEIIRCLPTGGITAAVTGAQNEIIPSPTLVLGFLGMGENHIGVNYVIHPMT